MELIETYFLTSVAIYHKSMTLGGRAATSEKFRGAKSLLATIMTSSMCSQPWCNCFATISLPTLMEEPFPWWGDHGRPQRGQNGHLLPLLIGVRTKYARKPEVNSLIPILIELILAITVCTPVWRSHCTRAIFTVLASCRDELYFNIGIELLTSGFLAYLVRWERIVLPSDFTA